MKLKFSSEDVNLLVEQFLPLAEKAESEFSAGISIYGAGFVGTWACQYLQSIGAKVDCFIDRDPQKQGTRIHGVPVFLPTEKDLASISTLLIAARHAVQDVLQMLQPCSTLLLSFDGFYVVKNYEHFMYVRDNFFNDECSIETYNAILVAMLTGKLESCKAVMIKDMYFAIPEFSGTFGEIFVDAGAFVGDTIERFIWENLGTFKHIYAFEPGVRQFLALKKRMVRLSEEWAFDLSTVTLEKAGLFSSAGQMVCTFLNDSPLRHGLTLGNSGNFDEASSSIVYALDSYLAGNPVSLIKADVEGMEMDLLKGAQETIRRCKPKMAICVYHYPGDLFLLAEYIKELVPEYQFCLRQHAPIFGDFVLYCYIK